MEPELCLNRTVYLADFFAEDYLVEFLDHLAGGKRTQVSTPLSGGAQRMVLGHRGEVFSVFNLLLDPFAFFLCLDQDVACSRVWHGFFRSSFGITENIRRLAGLVLPESVVPIELGSASD